jgi:hypothetical protein
VSLEEVALLLQLARKSVITAQTTTTIQKRSFIAFLLPAPEDVGHARRDYRARLRSSAEEQAIADLISAELKVVGIHKDTTEAKLTFATLQQG